MSDEVDAVIVGGGPAGMSAALVLGRCGRNVVVFDHGRYRNAVARQIHGFLTRDGIDPVEFRRIAREQLALYASVRVCEVEVIDARRRGRGFALQTADGRTVHSRTLLLATGLIDKQPQVEGLEPLLGLRAFHCPYCDGWENRNKPLLAYAHGDEGAKFALELTLWSPDITLCTDRGEIPGAEFTERLHEAGIAIRAGPIARFEADHAAIRAEFEDGSQLVRSALFYNLGCKQASALATKLGASFDDRDGVEASRCEETSVPNLFVAGDASRDALQAIVAAGEGSKAALAINKALMNKDLW